LCSLGSGASISNWLRRHAAQAILCVSIAALAACQYASAQPASGEGRTATPAYLPARQPVVRSANVPSCADAGVEARPIQPEDSPPGLAASVRGLQAGSGVTPGVLTVGVATQEVVGIRRESVARVTASASVLRATPCVTDVPIGESRWDVVSTHRSPPRRRALTDAHDILPWAPHGMTGARNLPMSDREITRG
jgi:hypothetical protein